MEVLTIVQIPLDCHNKFAFALEIIKRIIAPKNIFYRNKTMKQKKIFKNFPNLSFNKQYITHKINNKNKYKIFKKTVKPHNYLNINLLDSHFKIISELFN